MHFLNQPIETNIDIFALKKKKILSQKTKIEMY